MNLLVIFKSKTILIVNCTVSVEKLNALFINIVLVPNLEFSLVCNGWVEEILSHGRGVALSQVHISRLTHISHNLSLEF